MGTTEVKTVAAPRKGFTSEASRAGDLDAENPRHAASVQERDGSWALSAHLLLSLHSPEMLSYRQS